MQDLRLIFGYSKPYRRDLIVAVGLLFLECGFEMVIPVLMSTLIDEGVPAHDMQIILRQGLLMALCAVLALVTAALETVAGGYRWSPACCMPGSRPAMPTGLQRNCAWQNMPLCRNLTLPTWTIFPRRPWSPA